MDIQLINNSKKRIWIIENYPNDNDMYLNMRYGHINSKITERIKRIQQKNIGKANETSLEQQAIKEMVSLAKEKIDSGYKLVIKSNIEEFKELDFYSPQKCYFPMLANKYNTKLIKPNTIINIQPKIDGCRCIAYYKDNQVILKTRKGKDYIDLFEIKAELEEFFEKNPDRILDGEIYYHSWDFQRIVSACKARNQDTQILEYHIFDCIMDIDFKERIKFLDNQISKEYSERVKLVNTYFDCNKQEIEMYLQKYLEQGYEGLMIRLDDCKYIQDKRSNQLLKYKQFQDEEFEIVGYAKELLSNQEYGVVYIVKTDSGNLFNVRPKGDMQSRIDALKNIENDIGKMLTVRFQEKTQDFIPRFPVGIGIKLENN